MAFLASQRLRLPRSRLLVCDLLHFARQVPLFPLERCFALTDLAELRRRMVARISWSVLFIKAYGFLSAAYPQLRQTYLRWPWPHLYQHAISVANLAVNRAEPDGERLYWGRFIEPEAQTLTELQWRLDRYKTAPTQVIFRRQIRFSHVPTAIRRLGWWLTLNASGATRAKRFGTFGLSTLGGKGAVNRYHPTCLTTSLTYGPVDRSGQVLVTLLYDHRVADGSCIARALVDLEAIMQGPIMHELQGVYDSQKAYLGHSTPAVTEPAA
jgi:hypothetical protein